MNKEKNGIGGLYHRETRYRREAMPRGGLDWANQPAPTKEYPLSLRRFPIQPPILTEGKSIWEVMERRRSIRAFSSQPMTYGDLSQLIRATQGITSRGSGFSFRTAPSAGALYPIETYVVVNRVEGIPSGLYHYAVERGEIVQLKEGRLGPDLRRAGLGQEMLEEAACVFVWTAMIERSKWKYRERAFRYIYMDAGHIGQNLYLAAGAMGLGCCTVGAFYDEEVDRLIGVDGKEEVSVYMGAVGRIGT
jgi:SagB-type dehydrogenase family enzyme